MSGPPFPDPLPTRAVSRLCAELRSLYEAAGRPELADVVRWGAGCDPVVWFSVATLESWLRPDRVTVPTEGALSALVSFLTPAAPLAPDLDHWRRLRREAWHQVYAGPAGTDPLGSA